MVSGVRNDPTIMIKYVGHIRTFAVIPLLGTMGVELCSEFRLPKYSAISRDQRQSYEAEKPTR